MNIKFTAFLLLFPYLSCSLLFSSDTLLHDAASKGDRLQCSNLIKKGYDVNLKNRSGDSPLHAAFFYCGSEEKKKNICSFLLQHDANVNQKGYHGETPLHKAVFLGATDICSLFLLYKANPNQKNDSGATPLHLASMFGRQEIVSLLIGYQADLHAKDQYGCTPLHIAAIHGQLEVCTTLIGAGAHINKMSDGKLSYQDRYTAFQFASKRGYQKTCEMLFLCGADPNVKSGKGKTALSLTQSKSIKCLIKKMLTSMNNEESPLHWCAAKGDAKACAFVIKRGVNIYLQTKQGKTALELAKSIEVKNMILTYEEKKIGGYLLFIKLRESIPKVIIPLIRRFSVGTRS